jgi:hypothetical protein
MEGIVSIRKNLLFLLLLPISALMVSFSSDRAEAFFHDDELKAQRAIADSNDILFYGQDSLSAMTDLGLFLKVETQAERQHRLDKRDDAWLVEVKQFYPSCNGYSHYNIDDCVQSKYGEVIQDQSFYPKQERGNRGDNDRRVRDRDRGDNDRRVRDRDRGDNDRRYRDRDRPGNNRRVKDRDRPGKDRRYNDRDRPGRDRKFNDRDRRRPNEKRRHVKGAKSRDRYDKDRRDRRPPPKKRKGSNDRYDDDRSRRR